MGRIKNEQITKLKITKLQNDSMFACIYIPNFSVAAALRAEPELQAQPLAIFEGKPPLEKIIAVNENPPNSASRRVSRNPKPNSAPNSRCALDPRYRNPPPTPPCSIVLNRSRPA